jgi:uncharacterized ion transporter superfamily protein YfcC
MSDSIKKKRSFKMPTSYGILMLLMIVVFILGRVVPSGHYDYQAEDGTVISGLDVDNYDGSSGEIKPIPGSFKQLEKPAMSIAAIFTAPIKGFLNAGEVCIFVLVVGGLLGVITKTQAIDVGIASIMRSMQHRIYSLIAVLVILFSVGGTTYGMGEETVAFYPILLPIIIAAGFDAMTGGSIIMLGAGIGVLASIVNPFATGVASDLANVTLADGMALRFIQYLLFVVLTIVFIVRYAMKVKKHPEASVLKDLNASINAEFLSSDSNNSSEPQKVTGRQKAVLIIFAVTFIVMIYAVIPFADLGITAIPTLGWWFVELSGLFFFSALLCGIVYGLSEEDIVDSFINGAKDVLGVVLIIGLARGLSIMMNESMIIDSVLAFSEKTVRGLPSVLYINGVYWLHILLSIFIPSTSGLAAVSMPIMAPMADIAGVSRSLVITAYQSASGIVNLVSPTSGIIMGALILSKIPYERYLKFVWKFLALIVILTMAVLSLGALFNIG